MDEIIAASTFFHEETRTAFTRFASIEIWNTLDFAEF
jgi:hypothetical protein